MTITKQEIAMIRDMFARTRERTDTLVDAHNNPKAPPFAKKMVAAQNVLKDCITAVVNECVPIDEQFCGELAIRLASYAISIAPVERQEEIARLVAASLPAAHVDRMKRGVVIHSTWMEKDGVERRNMPEKGETN
jgi:hypothetical protein